MYCAGGSLLAQRSAANSFCREIRVCGYKMKVFRTFQWPIFSQSTFTHTHHLQLL